MKLHERVKKMKNGLSIKTFSEVSDSAKGNVKEHILEDEKGEEHGRIEEHDGKIVSMSASGSAQNSGALEEAVKKIDKKSEPTMTEKGMATAQMSLSADKDKRSPEGSDAEKAKEPKDTSNKMAKSSPSLAKKCEMMRKCWSSKMEKAGRCWEGYEPVPGKKPYSEGSCVKKSEDLEKKQGMKTGLDPKKFERCVMAVKKQGKTKGSAHAICNASMQKSESCGCNSCSCDKKMAKADDVSLKAEHKSDKGGLTEKGRKYYNSKTGSDLKRPQPEGGARKKSFCARMGGAKKEHGIDCKKDPKKRICLALKRWKC